MHSLALAPFRPFGRRSLLQKLNPAETIGKNWVLLAPPLCYPPFTRALHMWLVDFLTPPERPKGRSIKKKTCSEPDKSSTMVKWMGQLRLCGQVHEMSKPAFGYCAIYFHPTRARMGPTRASTRTTTNQEIKEKERNKARKKERAKEQLIGMINKESTCN